MRIISGTKRGMKLLPPSNMETRPITDRAKEALFSVLYKYDLLEDGNVGDLFCGTGSMGLECLSRGARAVTFVDMGRGVIKILNQNIERADFVAQSKVVCANILKIGAAVNPGQEKLDLIFLDPPYKMSWDTSENSELSRMLAILQEQIKPGGIVVVRTGKRAVLLDEYGQFTSIDRRCWGTTAVTLLQLKDGAESDE